MSTPDDSFPTMPAAAGEPPRVAVVGAGIAGAACAAGLQRAGFDVTVFDKSRGLGGRMATRRAHWLDEADGSLCRAEFDHGCPHFTVTRPRFQAVIDRAAALGCAAHWDMNVHAAFPRPGARPVVVATPNMPALCRHLLGPVPLRLGQGVTRLHRCPEGWWLHLTDDRNDSGAESLAEGPFRHVVLAIPPAQAAVLLKRHQPARADALAALRMAPCWTLMAVTDDLDWPWDAAEVEGSELAWVARNDHVPGRLPPGARVPWVAHATPAWSLAHLEDDPAQVEPVLRAALWKLLSGGRPPRCHHATVHRWRYAQLAQPAADGADCWWSARLGLGVCGDFFRSGRAESGVEAAWCSGDELADTIAASFDAALPTAPAAPQAKAKAKAADAAPAHRAAAA